MRSLPGEIPARSAERVRVRVLGSSSAGNCTLVWNDSTAVMVDCGFSPAYLRSCLHSLDLDIPPLAGVLVTHAHGDHVNDDAVAMLLRNGIPVVLRKELTRVMRRMYPSIQRAARDGRLIELGPQEGTLGAFGVESFRVPHDSPGGCFGFAIMDRASPGNSRVAIATDLGYTEEGLLERFRDSRVAVIESNHDLFMLENSGRPAWLKKRIKEIGHLSNDQCAGFVGELVRSSSAPPGTVVLAHMSQQCNTPELAERATAGALAREGFPSVRVVRTFRSTPSEIVTA